ncbi:MAG: hypothetical protein IJH12_01790 [Clostridia bacterium]|nr:hypothetical protein [Clostridia bacterium]
MKRSIFSKLKKSLIVTMIFITIGIAMPKKAKADIINDFVDLVLHIPDGVMYVIDHTFGGSIEFTSEELDLNNADDGGRGEVYNFIVTPYEIFSSGRYVDYGTFYDTNMGWLDINFFPDKPIVSANTSVSSEILAPVVGNIYISLRNLAMVLMLLVILYIGIKILISSIAAQQAKYKQLLMDWLVGFCLLFIMHYIMSGIVNLNTIVVNLLSNDEGDSYYIGVSELKGQFGATSRWLDVLDDKDSMLNGSSFENFKRNRLIVEGGDSSTSVYSVTESGVDTGYLNLNGQNNRGYKGGSVDLSKWGKNGEIYLAATIYNTGSDQHKNKAIIKLNAMSYVRTISSFASGSEWFSGGQNRKVHFYENATTIEASLSTAMGYSALYLCLVIETIMFLFTYVKRVLQMAFLTMIAPIVALMYPVDKIGDGKAQAFNTWFKDYLFNVLIQPMHLLLYTVFIVAAGELISKNIIYGLAVYGFMIPAEKYFKKILGFDKASTGGGGPLGGAVGHGLAMDGLGKLAGIGPAGRGGKGGSGGDGKGKSKIKTKKNEAGSSPAPLGSGEGGVPGASGGIGGSSSAGTGAGGRSGNRTAGSRTAGNGGTNRRNPNAGGAKPRSRDKRARGVIGKKVAGALTGGKYDHLNTRNGSWAEVGRHVLGRGLGRMVTRGAGAVLGGAVGVTAGIATAMATGDINNIWKGTAVGAGAGNKISSNLYDRGADFVESFASEMKQELANENSDEGKEMTQRIRNEEAFEKLDDDIEIMDDDNHDSRFNNQSDKQVAIDTVKRYAQYVDFDNIKDVKAMTNIRAACRDAMGEHEDTAVEIFNEAKGFDVETHRSSFLRKKMRQELGSSFDAKLIEDLASGKVSITDPSISSNTNLVNAYRNAVERADLVESVQQKMK